MTENAEDKRLGAFCSAFKVKKERRRNGANGTQATARNSKKNNTKTTTTNNNNNNNQKNTGASSKRNDPDNSGAPVVQIVNGEIVLQESSLMVPGQRRTVQEVDEEFQDVVEEDAQLAIVGASYTSFVDRKGPQHWKLEETKRFYEALRQMGTDFCAMEHFFEDRTRKQLKRKYQAELIRNPSLVEMALDPKKRAKVDISIFEVEVDPKAIEAAAKNEPPPYIPTDVPKEETTLENNDENTAPGGAMKSISKLEKWKEVIEEDAEEEARRGDGTRHGKANKKVTINEGSLWSSAHAAVEQDKDIDFPEPSMDDFFHEHDGIDEQLTEDDPAMEPPSNLDIKSQTSPTPAEEVKEVPAASSISLVPTKASAKSKKPKFRTISRKKK